MVLVRTSATAVAKVRYDGQTQGLGSTTETSYAGDCVTPAYMYLAGLPDPVLDKLGIRQLGRTSQHLYVRCRRCSACLRQRGRVWIARASAETYAARRTWFGTLTLHPDRATEARYAADRALQDAISDRGDTSNQFLEMVKYVQPEITRFLKRVRKNTDARIRYLLVTERHKSGVPHWHCLIHEYAGSAPKRALHTAWRYGFSQFKLVDIEGTRSARYVCKYIAKEAITRIRASRYYGSAMPDLLTDRLLSLSEQINSVRRKHASPQEGPLLLERDGDTLEK